jgi:hypothetical protein
LRLQLGADRGDAGLLALGEMGEPGRVREILPALETRQLLGVTLGLVFTLPRLPCCPRPLLFLAQIVGLKRPLMPRRLLPAAARLTAPSWPSSFSASLRVCATKARNRLARTGAFFSSSHSRAFLPSPFAVMRRVVVSMWQ